MSVSDGTASMRLLASKCAAFVEPEDAPRRAKDLSKGWRIFPTYARA